MCGNPLVWCGLELRSWEVQMFFSCSPMVHGCVCRLISWVLPSIGIVDSKSVWIVWGGDTTGRVGTSSWCLLVSRWSALWRFGLGALPGCIGGCPGGPVGIASVVLGWIVWRPPRLCCPMCVSWVWDLPISSCRLFSHMRLSSQPLTCNA